MDGFSERFKYAVCSSGLLEKDYVPGFGGPSEGKEERDGHEGASTLEPETAGWDLQEEWRNLRGKAKERWDITAAIAAMVLGLLRLLGIRLVLVSTLLAGGLAWKTHQRQGSVAPTIVPIAPVASVISTTSPPKSSALSKLSDFLSSCRQFDNTIEKSLSILQPLPPNSTALYELRLALSRLTNDMTDHLATATSSILEITDKDELAVLGEMYDIPAAGSFLYPRKVTNHLDDEPETESWLPVSQSVPLGNIPSPRRPNLSLRPPGDLFQPNGDSAQAMSISRSLPGRFKPTHRTHHLSLSASPYHPSLRSAPDDHFTQLPERTPRYNKRASWDSSVWSSIRDGGLAPSPSIRSRRLSRPSHERRITEADEGEANVEGDTSLTSSQSSRPPSLDRNGLIPLSLPTSPTPISKPFTPRRSPLSGSVSDYSPRTSTRPVNPFPSFTSSTPNPKRRSLQNMQYYPSSDDDRPITTSSETDLTRTRSSPFSDIQALRSKYATGSRSRRESLVGHQSPPTPNMLKTYLTSPTPAQPRIRRVVSVSPLTLPSLKAGCLGIHLKRRRLACCLLGLRFGETDDTYWSDLSAVLGVLIEAIDAERVKLDAECSTALANDRNSDVGDARPPWMVPSASGGQYDFAPKTSDEVLLRDKIREMEQSLEKAWRGLQVAKQTLQYTRTDPPLSASSIASTSTIAPDGDLEAKWKDLRGELGYLIRDWERGKEVVHRIMLASQPEQTGMDGPDGSTEEDDLSTSVPDFIQAWSEPEHDRARSGDSTSFDSDRQPESLDEQPDPFREMTEDLPLPGKDIVFEADMEDMPIMRERSKLSREERIKLTKEAREKGVSVDQLLALSSGRVDVVDGSMERMAKETGKTHGLVVEEMKTMIGMIRAKKGVQEGDQ